MPKFISDEEMAALEAQASTKPGFISDEEMDLHEKAFAPSPSLRELEKARTPGWQSALQGAASSMALGADDEIGGAIMGMLPGRTVSGEIDRIRDKKKIAQEANPGAHLAGSVGGAIVSPGLLTAKAGAGWLKTVGVSGASSALSGAAQRAGDAEGGAKDKAASAVDPKSLGMDFGLGALTGSGGYAIAKGAKALSKPSENIIEPISDYVNAAKTGAKEGTGTLSSAVKSIDKILEVKANRAEASALAANFRRHAGPGSSKNLSDKEVLSIALMDEGPNQIKTWVSRRAGIQLGTDGDAFGRLLNESGSTTKQARNFNKVAGAETLAGDASTAYKGMKKGAGETYEALTNEARRGAKQLDDSPLQELAAIQSRIAEDSTISATSKNYLKEAQKILGDDFTSLDPQSQFDRILAARRKLGGGAKFAAKTDVPEGAEAVKDAYGALNKYMRALDGQASADRGYTGFKDVEKRLFKPISETSRGNIRDIDPIKAEDLLSNTKNGRRLKAQIERVRQQMTEGKLTPEQAASLKPMLDNYDALSKTSNLKGDLDKFRYQGEVGVSGRVQEKLDSITNKNTFLDDAQRNPELFLRRREAVDSAAMDLYGKAFKDLTQDEKVMLIRRLNKVKAGSDGSLGGDIKSDRDTHWTQQK